MKVLYRMDPAALVQAGKSFFQKLMQSAVRTIIAYGIYVFQRGNSRLVNRTLVYCYHAVHQ